MLFMDKYITTEFLEDHPNLNLHIHHCTESCHLGQKDKTKCRHHFPKFVTPTTRIFKPIILKNQSTEMKSNLQKIRAKMEVYKRTREDQSFEKMLEELKMSEAKYYDAIRCSIKSDTVFYKRRRIDVLVNTYKSDFLDTWEANHDLQNILDPYGAIYYLFEYCFKTDKGMIEMMKKAVEECKEGNDDLFNRLRAVSNAFVNSSLVSAQQAADYILGHPMTMFSVAERFVNTNLPEKRVVMKKSEQHLEEMDEEETEIAETDFIEKYSKRPDDMEDVCLADFAAWYEKDTCKKAQKNFENEDEDEGSDVEMIENLPKQILYRRRGKAKIIRFPPFLKEIDPVNFYRSKVMLYHPWRDEQKELIDMDGREVYNAHLSTIVAKHAIYNHFNEEELEALRHQVETDLADLFAEEIAEFEREELDDDDKIDVFEQLGIEIREKRPQTSNDKAYKVTAPPRISEEDLANKMKMLNMQQREIYMHIYHAFKNGKIDEKIVVLGSAGTGKSFLIDTIYQLMTRYFDRTRGGDKGKTKVLLMAPTGIAAFQIDGSTIHSALSLPKNQLKFKKLSDDIREELNQVEIIIFDEVSMISNEHFSQADKRMRQVMGIDGPFGGKCVIFLGDFLQLQPVMERPVYQSSSSALIEKFAEFFVWREFKLFELTEVMRQKDQKYREAVYHCALGTMNKADMDLIKARTFKFEKDVTSTAVRLFHTNADVNNYNRIKIENSPGQSHYVEAIDKINAKSFPKATIDKMLGDYKNDKIADTRVPFSLVVKSNIKYMIVVNIDIADGLVNGNIGMLKFITFNPNDNATPLILWLDFNNPKVGISARVKYAKIMKDRNIDLNLVPILKQTLTMTSLHVKQVHEAFRTQFRLQPAEAMTIHKSQGSTIKTICIDFRNLNKQPDATLKYVALSKTDYDGLGKHFGKLHSTKTQGK